METRPTTISKVIAFELGLLIAVLTWIAFAGIPGVKPRAVAEAEEPADTSFANVSPIYQPTQPRRRAPVNYPADDLQVAQTGAQYRVATVQTYDPGLTAGGYGDTVNGSGQLSYGYDQPGVEGYIVNQDPADSIGIFPEPVLDSPYCYYSPYGYSQPVQIVVLNNNRVFVPRNRIARRGFAWGMPSAPRRNPRATPPMQGGRIATRPAPVATGPNVRPRSRVNPGNGNSAPRRTAPVRTTRPGQASQALWNP
jgi:hypothetical protein